MGEWHFIPWNMQYLGGGILALAITILVFRKNTQALSYRSFLAFGVFVIIWMFSVFIGRSAPSLSFSIGMYRIIFFTFLLAPPLLLLTILSIGSERRIYYLTLIPMLTLSLYSSISAQFDVSWTNFGWAYSIKQEFIPISMLAVMGYYASIIITLVVFILKQRLSYLRKKYTLILFGFLLYSTVLTITNIKIWSTPNTAPVGGFMVTIEFLFIAYAVSLRPSRIEFIANKSLDSLSDAWLRFLQKIRDVLPGSELGGDADSYQNYIRSIGIIDIMDYKNGHEVLDTARLSLVEMNEAMDKTTNLMKQQSRALQAVTAYTDVFIELYRILRKDSTGLADSWLNTMLRDHGGFLDKQGILVAMPQGVRLPPIFKELQRGKVYLFKEEKPAQAYERLKEALEYGFVGLCFTKLEPEKVRARYEVEKASLVWLTFQQTNKEEELSPKDLEGMSHIISTRIDSPTRVVVLLDCLDQIIFANSFAKVRVLLMAINKLCVENAATILISIDDNMFSNEQMDNIEELLQVK